MNVQKLIDLNACSEAVEWVKTQKNAEQAWNNCDRGDWMLWLIGKTIAGEPMSDERKPLVLAACDCAEFALKYVPKGEDRPRKAIEIARKWANGDSSISQQIIRSTADAAAYAADAADAADAAAYAADAAAYTAAYTADAAAYAAAAAYTAADAAAYAADAAKEKILKQCADIVRKHYPKSPINDSSK